MGVRNPVGNVMLNLLVDTTHKRWLNYALIATDTRLMLPTLPYSSTLALPVSATRAGRAVDGSVVLILLLAGIIVVGPLAALDILVLALVVLLISLLILG